MANRAPKEINSHLVHTVIFIIAIKKVKIKAILVTGSAGP
jgi:purine nucleoside phosphorylase